VKEVFIIDIVETVQDVLNIKRKISLEKTIEAENNK
jgi:hypothetical protein